MPSGFLLLSKERLRGSDSLAARGAVVAAVAATFLLRPRSGLIEPASIDVTGHFRLSARLAEDFRTARLLGSGPRAGTATLAILTCDLSPRLRAVRGVPSWRRAAGRASPAAVLVELPFGRPPLAVRRRGCPRELAALAGDVGIIGHQCRVRGPPAGPLPWRWYGLSAPLWSPAAAVIVSSAWSRSGSSRVIAPLFTSRAAAPGPTRGRACAGQICRRRRGLGLPSRPSRRPHPPTPTGGLRQDKRVVLYATVRASRVMRCSSCAH